MVASRISAMTPTLTWKLEIEGSTTDVDCVPGGGGGSLSRVININTGKGQEELA